MSENVFWITICGIIATVICVFIVSVSYVSMQNNKSQYEIISKCVESGGFWVGQGYQCLRK